MRFGLFGGPGGDPPGAGEARHPYLRFADYAILAEELGFAGAFLTEHHFTGLGQASSPLTLLAHLAARTRTLRLGTAVTVLPWHNPIIVAEQAATVDVLSGGRLDLGVGRGFRAAEFEGFGQSMEEATARHEESLEVILRAWREPGRWSHRGVHFTYRDVVVEPAPLQRPHPPIWVGAGSPASLDDAARRGFRLLLDQVASFAVTGERIAHYRERRAEHGDPAGPGEIAVTRSLHLVDGPRERAAAIEARVQWFERMLALTNRGRAPANRMASDYSADMRRATEEGSIIGDAAECAQRLQALREQGADYVLLIDGRNSEETLRAFAAEVAPRLG
jgi:alkanesulfonate monooxygenase SsuD/methylene tetrahydromethanopterin reductase-like flavin-dependent oxidoreductase (luciferase family)